MWDCSVFLSIGLYHYTPLTLKYLSFSDVAEEASPSKQKWTNAKDTKKNGKQHVEKSTKSINEEVITVDTSMLRRTFCICITCNFFHQHCKKRQNIVMASWFWLAAYICMILWFSLFVGLFHWAKIHFAHQILHFSSMANGKVQVSITASDQMHSVPTIMLNC